LHTSREQGYESGEFDCAEVTRVREGNLSLGTAVRPLWFGGAGPLVPTDRVDI